MQSLRLSLSSLSPTPHPLTPGLGQWVSIPCTYAGGAKDLADLALVDTLSNGKVDLTFGSALDIFGGKGVKFDELVEADKKAKIASASASAGASV